MSDQAIKPLDQFNPFAPEVIENPWAFFAALRREAPLYQLPNKAYYLISRYEDVMQAALDTDTYSSNLVAVLLQDNAETAPQFLDLGNAGQGEGESESHAVQAVDVLAIADQPRHTRQRRITNRAFTHSKIMMMEPEIRALANRLADGFLAQGRFDWVRDMAMPLPMTIIIRLLGFPEHDLEQLKQWSDHSVALLSGVNTSDELVQHGIAVTRMFAYLAERYEEERRAPRANIIGDLIRASQEDAEALSRNEIISIMVQLLTAGNETTTSLIGSAMMLMLQTPGLQQQLRDNPDRMEAFVEEAVRLESPFHGHFRLVKKDTEVAGTRLPAGSRVMLLWSSANRDEQAFHSAESVSLNRQRKPAHVSFGYGIHLCIGAALARLEARVVLETILQRTGDIRLAADNDFCHVPSLFVRSLQRLELEFSQGR